MAEHNVLEDKINSHDIQSNAKNITSANCPVVSAIEVIGGKWTIIVLYQLRQQTLRFGELHQLIPGITKKMLTQELRKLEANGLVTRQVYAEVPPRVEYTPTDLANGLNPALDLLCAWGATYQVTQNS